MVLNFTFIRTKGLLKQKRVGFLHELNNLYENLEYLDVYLKFVLIVTGDIHKYQQCW